MPAKTLIVRPVVLALLFAIFTPRAVLAQSTEISTEYLMTLHAPLDAPQEIDESLVIYNVLDGGWVKGPKIEGKLRAPGGDWLQVLPNGTFKLDVRLTIETDDGALIYMSYNGVIGRGDAGPSERQRGEDVESNDIYFITAPTLRTSSEKYGWLNHIQCIGKMTRSETGVGAFVEYDIFAVR